MLLNHKPKSRVCDLGSSREVVQPYVESVSYTHLDVYKRQHFSLSCAVVPVGWPLWVHTPLSILTPSETRGTSSLLIKIIAGTFLRSIHKNKKIISSSQLATSTKHFWDSSYCSCLYLFIYFFSLIPSSFPLTNSI